MAEEQSCVTVQPSDLLQFLEEVRGTNLPFSPQQLISAHELLLTLVAQGEWPEDPLRFQTLLAPVLCSSPEQQAFFYTALRSWLEERKIPIPPDPPAPPPIPIPAPRRPRFTFIHAINLFAGVPLLILHTCALVAFSVVVLLQSKVPDHVDNPTQKDTHEKDDSGTKPPPPVIPGIQTGLVTDNQDQPLANVEVAYLHKTISSDSNGHFQLQFADSQSQFFVLFSRAGYSPQLRQAPLAGEL